MGCFAFFFSQKRLTAPEGAKFFLLMEAMMSFGQLVAKFVKLLGEEPVPSGEGGFFFVRADFEVFKDGGRIVLWSPKWDLGRQDWSSPEEAWDAFRAAATA